MYNSISSIAIYYFRAFSCVRGAQNIGDRGLGQREPSAGYPESGRPGRLLDLAPLPSRLMHPCSSLTPIHVLAPHASHTTTD